MYLFRASQKTPSLSFRKTNQLMFYRRKLDIYFKNQCVCVCVGKIGYM